MLLQLTLVAADKHLAGTKSSLKATPCQCHHSAASGHITMAEITVAATATATTATTEKLTGGGISRKLQLDQGTHKCDHKQLQQKHSVFHS